YRVDQPSQLRRLVSTALFFVMALDKSTEMFSFTTTDRNIN
ncbi:uncharacterized, partial [Tachysurus ichikawai]